MTVLQEKIKLNIERGKKKITFQIRDLLDALKTFNGFILKIYNTYIRNPKTIIINVVRTAKLSTKAKVTIFM